MPKARVGQGGIADFSVFHIRECNETPGQDKYLLLRRLAESNRMEAWANVLERSYGDNPAAIHALASCLFSTEFFPRRHVFANLHRLVLYHLLRESGLSAAGDPRRPAA